MKKTITWSGLAVAGLIGALVLGVGTMVYQHERDARKVQVQVSSGTDKGCAPEYPALITVTNNSPRTVLALDVRVDMREPGHSTVTTSVVHDDFVVMPGETHSTCWRLPANMTYSFAGKDTTF